MIGRIFGNIFEQKEKKLPKQITDVEHISLFIKGRVAYVFTKNESYTYVGVDRVSFLDIVSLSDLTNVDPEITDLFFVPRVTVEYMLYPYQYSDTLYVRKQEGLK